MRSSQILVDNKKIGKGFEPFIIAEMSGNHNHSLKNALDIVQSAADSGVDAIKLQTYTPDTITLDVDSKDFVINDPKSIWKGKKLYDLYNIAYTPWDWHEPIMEKAKALGLICFSSPFDETAVDFLETLNVPMYKIASFENNHLPLIRKVSATGKPIIVSTGASTLLEIDELVTTARDAGCKDLILLKCTSSYPASPADSNILTIPHLRKLFDCEVGLSDHTLGIGAAIAAVSLGATLIEKHFTLDRGDGGVDSAFSMEPREMKSLTVESKNAWQSLGKISYGLSSSELKSIHFKRSIFVSKNMKLGDIFTENNIRIVRPGNGLHPRYYDKVLGKKVSKDVKKGTALDWNHILNR
jgi:N-acetylneuraminate synthase